VPDAGNVFIHQVRMRLIKYGYLSPPYGDAAEFTRRWKAEGEGITVGGDNVQITDCDFHFNSPSVRSDPAQFS
jgi:hypothetical protein